MHSLPPLSAASAERLSLPAPAIANPEPAGTPSGGGIAATPSTNVTLTDAESARLSQTYTADGTLAPSTPVWEHDGTDTLSGPMSVNFHSSTLAGRFNGLGAALLDRFAVDGGDYSQSLMLRPPGSGSGSDGASVSQSDRIRQTLLHTVADNQITLDIQTVGGATVRVSLSSQGGALGVQITTSNGTLSGAERDAVAGLADAFQDAIDGLASVPPRLALEGLTQFDSTVLSSVNLQSSFKLSDGSVQTLDFQADAAHRSVAYTGAAGTVNVEVDLSNPALIGSADQQSRALAAYMRQFDQAQSRGQGDAELMTMFKDAFGALNSHYGANAAPPAAGSYNPVALTDTDHAMLSGLADFSASVRASDRPSPNPMRDDEKDTFSYQVSQQTNTQGRTAADRAIEQSQQSHLTASYHTALYPDTPLNLTGDKYSQNYYYTQIDDTASSVANIAYKDGALVKASVTQSIAQSTNVKKYVVGELQQDLNTPSSVSRTWELADLLHAARPKEDGSATDADWANWRNTLSTINDLVVLNADPTQLRNTRITGAKAQDSA
ncbi:hypothetical protein [Bordetella flabilis]|uniref:Lactate dehydrogenase n=1 Tax=Bordetella flabilis TaxID=463014 RepID=A0A193GED5_9BORD|nr:hypothetical protein [Bordetella flabilis]ANN77811.1 hypothetical protein BAU07_12515 [Bordetella flabilis]